jgi:hypothetical protein
MLRMTVEGVGFDHHKNTVVVLKDWENKKLLPIWIGAAEARSIALHLEGTAMPRPLSHDLMLSCIGAGGGRVTRVVINDLQEGTYYATIDVDTPNGVLHVDSRPSDAIALAVRAECPVFVDGAVLNELIDITPDEDATTQGAESGGNGVKPEAQQSSKFSDDELDRFRRLVGDLDL